MTRVPVFPARVPRPTARFRALLMTVVGVMSAAGAANALAQLAQTRPDAGQILEQQRDRIPVAPRSDREVLPQEEQQARPAMRGSPALKVTVKQFKISGNRIYPETELLTAVADQYGKVLDFDGLNDAALAVRAYYRARGYFLAQAYLPAQQIRNGVVEIAVLEGRVGIVELKMAPGARLRPEFAQGILEEHLKTGDPITETGLERPLLLLSDLPNVVVNSEIGPSTKSIGAADLRVNVKESAGTVSGYADLDNAGNRFTGEWRLGISMNGNNLTGFGDQVAFRGTMSDERMLFARAAWTVPVGYNGTRVGLSYAEFDYRLAKDFAPLEGHGEGGVLSAFGLHPFVRTRNANLIGQASYESKILKDRVDTTNSVEDRKIITFKLGLVGDFRDRIFGGALNSFSLSYTDGDLSLSPSALLAADQSAATGLRTQGKFAKTNFDARRLQLITENINLLLALSGQLANKNLASAEKMSLGGANGVRGYPTGEAVGDAGFLFTTELRYLPPKFQIWTGDVTFSGFYDAGRVRINQLPLPGTVANFRGISSYGFGLSVGKDNDFLLKTSLAWRGENETPVADSARREPHVWVQAIKWF